MRATEKSPQTATLVEWIAEKSLIQRLASYARLSRLIDDHVAVLSRNPLGMLFYNLRAIFFGCSFLFLSGLFLYSLAERNYIIVKGSTLLFVFWSAGFILTLGLHSSFRDALVEWSSRTASSDLRPLFDRYFLLDSLLLIAILITGRYFGLPFDAIAFLLFANTVVYMAYIGGSTKQSGIVSGVIFSSLIAGFLVLVQAGEPSEKADKLARSLELGGLVAMIAFTLLPLMLILHLRTTQQAITSLQLARLGEIERQLAHPAERHGFDWDERQFRRQLKQILAELCDRKKGSYYQSAALWFHETHQDQGGLLLLGPAINVERKSEYRIGVKPPPDYLLWDQPVLRQVLDPPQTSEDEWLNRLAPKNGVIGSLVPIRTSSTLLGVLVLYAHDRTVAVSPHEADFLSSLGSIIGNSLDQWRGRFKEEAQQAMNGLLGADGLDEVFNDAATLLRRYLYATGCMILFRPDQKETTLMVMAVRGLKSTIKDSRYFVGRGMTGQCALTGRIRRIDSVEAHRKEFDADLLGRLEAAHRQTIHSWMAIPIGDERRNLGVIKVVNSKFRCPWFTDFDEELAKGLAVRLYVLLDRFLETKKTEEARVEAQTAAERARRAREEAIRTAEERQEDLMVMTHQLQGALISVTGALTSIEQSDLDAQNREMLEFAVALLEDANALAYGTSTTFAREAGARIAFTKQTIDAPQEMRALAERLRKTNPRDDLRFVYRGERSFPKLQMNRDVFTSVLYSLVHNALKYGDTGTTVVLECSYEENSGEAALKVKSVGEPIDPDESVAIFQRFVRGRNVERGQHHRGVGLGLWVARELMQAVGGDLTVELSERYPRLSVFVVHVPEAASSTSAASRGSFVESPGDTAATEMRD